MISSERVFTFVGKLPASKSILNRALLMQSYFPSLVINGDSQCDDVRLMKAAVKSVVTRGAGSTDTLEIEVGSAGTVLRFMALRVSRERGKFRLIGERRLFQRPQTELLKILNQLSVKVELGENFLEIESEGWSLQGDTLLVPGARSSQFASAVLLNSWDLPFELFVSTRAGRVSRGYWRMSVQMAEDLGMKIDFWDGDFRVPKHQVVNNSTINVEVDLSSAFAVAAIAALRGNASLLEFPMKSLQPDHVFVEILERMGVPIQWANGALRVERAKKLNGVLVNLSSSPDLFPVLAALCALADGESDLFGAPQLVFKESDRLAKTSELLTKIGSEVTVKADGLIIRGRPQDPPTDLTKPIRFDPEDDHRLAFAAAVLLAAGFPIEILRPKVVSKSFPEFWSILECLN